MKLVFFSLIFPEKNPAIFCSLSLISIFFRLLKLVFLLIRSIFLLVISKSKKLHKIESLIAFIELHDLIFIKRIRSKNHRIVFNGKFSKNISSSNTISKLLKLLERKKLIHQKYFIKVTKNIPQKSGLGGGSMNAANILRYFIR